MQPENFLFGIAGQAIADEVSTVRMARLYNNLSAPGPSEIIDLQARSRTALHFKRYRPAVAVDVARTQMTAKSDNAAPSSTEFEQAIELVAEIAENATAALLISRVTETIIGTGTPIRQVLPAIGFD